MTGFQERAQEDNMPERVQSPFCSKCWAAAIPLRREETLKRRPRSPDDEVTRPDSDYLPSPDMEDAAETAAAALGGD